MAVFTVLAFWGLRWREGRMAAARPAPRPGWVAKQKASVNRWVTAAAIAAIGTTVAMGILHWLRMASG